MFTSIRTALQYKPMAINAQFLNFEKILVIQDESYKPVFVYFYYKNE